MKTAFLIAGLDIHETAAVEEFLPLREAIAAKGFRVLPVDISWRQTTPTQFAKQFVNFYDRHKGSENIVIGNSFGAVVAFLTAAELCPDLVMLCSLSPFFAEDTGEDWPPHRYLRLPGKRRLEDIRGYKAAQIANEINKQNVRVKVLFGELEHRTSSRLVARCKHTAKQLRHSELIELEGAPHNFLDPRYSRGIVEQLDVSTFVG